MSAVTEQRAVERDRLLPLALAAVALLAVAWRGGYTQAGRGAVVVLAGVAIAVALQRYPLAAASALRSPPPLLLAALALLGAVSAAWTVASAADALRWALVLLALAAVMVAAAALPGPGATGAILLLVAVPAAAAGVVGALAHADRIGLNICGSWRPAGPFEYPPALALACTSALPCAVAAMTRIRGRWAFAPAAAGWLLAATVAVSGSRLEVALAVLALVAAAAFLPSRAGDASPARAATLLAVAGAASAVLVGGDLGNDGALAPIAAGVVGLLAGLVWLLLRDRGPLAARLPWLAAVCVVGIAGVGASTAAERVSGCADSGFAHGRSGIWAAAVQTARQRPLVGHGLESFAVASRSSQLRRRPVPVQYAHDLPLEAWVELGVPGALLVVALFGAVLLAAARAGRPAAVLLGPAAVAFLAANLLDWPWHLAGAGVLWALAVGGLIGARAQAPGRQSS